MEHDTLSYHEALSELLDVYREDRDLKNQLGLPDEPIRAVPEKIAGAIEAKLSQFFSKKRKITRYKLGLILHGVHYALAIGADATHVEYESPL